MIKIEALCVERQASTYLSLCQFRPFLSLEVLQYGVQYSEMENREIAFPIDMSLHCFSCSNWTRGFISASRIS